MNRQFSIAPLDSLSLLTRQTHAEAFAAIESEIAAVPNEEIVTITANIPRAVQTAMGAARRIETLMPELARLPADLFDLPRARKLRLYAGATLYTHLLAVGSEAPDSSLRVLLGEATALCRDLLTVAEALGSLGLVSTARLATIRRGTGHRRIASNLTALAALYDAEWSRLGSPMPITREQVDRAAVLGTSLLQALGDRQLGANPIEPIDDASRTRARAYTLFVRSYSTCRQGVSFLRWWHGDARKFVPPLQRRARRRIPATRPVAPASQVPPATRERVGEVIASLSLDVEAISA